MDSRAPHEEMEHHESRTWTTIKSSLGLGPRSNVPSDTKRRDRTRIPTQPSEPVLQDAINHEEKQLADLKYDIEDLRRDKRRYEAKILETQRQISITNKEIATVGQDLAATRVHAPGEATLSSQQLVEQFMEMAGSINTIVLEFAKWYEPLTAKPLSDLRARNIRNHIKKSNTMWSADTFIEGAIGQDLSLVAEGLIRHHLCSFVMAHVFRPFLPGKSSRETDIAILLEIQVGVRQNESQDYSGRWRALSYKHAMGSRSPTWRKNHALECAKEMKNLFIVLTDVGLRDDSLKIALQLTTRMVDFAVQFKDDTMQLCTEMNHYVYFPDFGQEYNSTKMQEAVEGKKQSTQVILPIGLGIQRSWSIIEDSQPVQKYETAIPAEVVGNQSVMLSLPR